MPPSASSTSSISFSLLTFVFLLLLASSDFVSCIRVAVGFFGMPRALSEILPQVHARLLNPLRRAAEVTIFVHTFNVSVLNNPRSLEVMQRNDPMSILLLEPNYYEIESEEAFLQSLPRNYCRQHGDPWDNDWISVNNVLCSLHSQHRLVAMIDERSPFDLVIIARLDLLYFTPVDVDQLLAAKPMELFIPPFDNYWGVNDRFAAGTQATMALYGRRIEDLGAFCDQFEPHAETFLREYLDDYRVILKRTPLLFGRVRMSGLAVERPFWHMHRLAQGEKISEVLNYVPKARHAVSVVERPHEPIRATKKPLTTSQLDSDLDRFESVS